MAFAYDADGRRLWREANLTSVTLHARVAVFSGWRIVQETDADGTSLTQLVSGVALDEHLAQDFDLDGDGVANGLADKRVYFHQNPLLSVYGETDRLGRVVRGREYDPYGAQHLLLNGADADGVVNFDSSDIRTLGEPVTAAWSPSFTGKPAVGVADLYWLGKRYLDAGDGRFLSRDTIQGPTGPVWGSVSALLKNDRLPPWDPLRETPYADGPNLEAYVGDSPMNFTDPLGLFTHGVGKACKHYLPPHGEVQRAINALTAPSPSQYTCMSDKAQNAKVTCSHDGCGPCSSTNGTKGDTDARNNITVCMDECNRQVPKCGPQDLVKILVHEMAHACGMPGELGNKAGTAQPWPDGQTAPPPWNGHGIPGTEPDPNDPGNSTPGHIKCMGK